MCPMASQITILTIVYSTVYSGANQRKHQSSASLAFVRGIRWWPVNSPTKGQKRGKCFHLMTASCSFRPKWVLITQLYRVYYYIWFYLQPHILIGICAVDKYLKHCIDAAVGKLFSNLVALRFVPCQDFQMWSIGCILSFKGCFRCFIYFVTCSDVLGNTELNPAAL